MFSRIMIVAAVAHAIPLACIGEDDYAGWYRMVTSDTKADNSSYTRENWTNSPAATPVAPVAEGSHYVQEGYKLYATRSSSTTVTFPGKTLAVAGSVYGNTQYRVYSFNDLRLLPGGKFHCSTYNVSIAGNITVEATDDNPAVFRTLYNTGSTGQKCSATITGASGTKFVVSNGFVAPVDPVKLGRADLMSCPVSIEKDFAGFDGCFGVDPYTYVLASASVQTFPGGIEVAENAIFGTAKTSGEITVGDMKLADGAELYFPVVWGSGECAKYTVTNSLVLSGALRVNFGTLWTNGYVIARLTGPAALSAPDLSGIEVVSSGPLPRNAVAGYIDNPDGSKDIRITWDPITLMVSANANQPYYKSAFFEGDESYAGNESYWRPQAIPPSSYEGDIYTERRIMFWYFGTLPYDGTVLVMGGDSTLYNQAYDLCLKELHVCEGATVRVFASNAGKEYDHKLRCPVIVHGAELGFTGGWGDKWHALYGTLSGSGSVTVSHSSAYGNRMKGSDAGFTGDYAFEGYEEYGVSARPVFYIEVGNGFSFGGEYAGESAWDSVTFRDCPYMLVSSNATVRSDRGVFIDGGAVFELPSDVTLDIGGTMTFGGEMVKRGDGVLVLGGGAPGFCTNMVHLTEPPGGSNVLRIAEGALRVASAGAVDGLEVVFGEGASLVVDAAASGELAAYGARNVKWAKPFSSVTEGGTIKVSVDADPVPESPVTVAVCTVTSEAAESLSFDIPARVAKGRKSKTEWRDNGDGTKTFLVSVLPYGMQIVVR